MALITNTDSSTLPYNDDEMVYDLDRRMYVLTDLGVKRLTGYDIVELSGNKTKAEITRYRISQDMINYIRRYTMLDGLLGKLYAIAKDESIRSVIKQALVEQTLYYIESGAGLLKTQHGIDIGSSKALDINSLRGRALISPSAEMLLLYSGLLYRGRLYTYNFEEDGTW